MLNRSRAAPPPPLRSALAACALAACAGVPADAPPAPPERWIWAWEAPADLTAAPPTIGVAWLARTVRIGAGSGGPELSMIPRMQPLRVAPGAPVIAVVRVEIAAGALDGLDAAGTDRLAGDLAGLVAAGAPAGVPLQVDLDARRSERGLYRALLARLRASRTERLEMTAIASWCLGDNWIDSLPVDRVVPMVFDMGAEAQGVARHLAGGGDLRAGRCREAWGTAVYERRDPPSDRAIYLFSGRAWSADQVAIHLPRLLRGAP